MSNNTDYKGLEARIEALITLLMPIARANASSKAEAKNVEEKTIRILIRKAQLSQAEIARMLGVDIHRVNQANKAIKGGSNE